METKLTLKMEKKVINTAKMYAKRNNRSLSKIVENYFRNLSPEHNLSKKHSPIVERLSGVLSEDDLDKIAHEDERARYILNKKKAWYRKIKGTNKRTSSNNENIAN